MSASRRANGAKTKTIEVPFTNIHASKSNSAAMPSAYLPTRTELLFLLIFPLTLILGSLYTTFTFPTFFPYYSAPDVSSPPATYSHTHQSFQPASRAPSYFATKRNVFNVYFVKIGWFWVTLALLSFTLLAARGRRTVDVGVHGWSYPAKRLQDMDEREKRIESGERFRRVYQAFTRYVAVTCWWLFATQWFFGPSLIDRLFRLTGGICEKALAKEEGAIGQGLESELLQAVSAVACKAKGGKWKNGFDVSGHVFLLTIGSGMLLLEVLPIIFSGLVGLAGARILRTSAGKNVPLDEAVPSNYNRHDKVIDKPHLQYHGPTTPWKKYATLMALCVTALSWWMLLMTSMFFHTWIEKTVALVLATSALWTVYMVPRSIPLARNILGIPGM